VNIEESKREGRGGKREWGSEFGLRN
jgi:hypothetical protein